MTYSAKIKELLAKKPKRDLPTRVSNRVVKVMNDSLSCELRVRIDDRTTVHGVIKEVVYLGMRNRGKDTVAQFKIRMVCGKALVDYWFIVERLPSHYVGGVPEVKAVDKCDEI